MKRNVETFHQNGSGDDQTIEKYSRTYRTQ